MRRCKMYYMPIYAFFAVDTKIYQGGVNYLVELLRRQ
jgi:hypothetical protein